MAEQTPGGLVLVARMAAAFPADKDVFTAALQWMWENVDAVRVRAALAIALTRRGEEHLYADAVLEGLIAELQESG